LGRESDEDRSKLMWCQNKSGEKNPESCLNEKKKTRSRRRSEFEMIPIAIGWNWTEIERAFLGRETVKCRIGDEIRSEDSSNIENYDFASRS
jgi:hypothetical protein